MAAHERVELDASDARVLRAVIAVVAREDVDGAADAKTLLAAQSVRLLHRVVAAFRRLSRAAFRARFVDVAIGEIARDELACRNVDDEAAEPASVHGAEPQLPPERAMPIVLIPSALFVSMVCLLV